MGAGRAKRGPGGEQRILVVDDDPQVVKVFGRILQKGGYSVTVAPSGGDVLKILQNTAVDVVVLDLSAPQTDGFELLKRLRTSMPGLRVLVISGFLDGILLRAAELMGATATLRKREAPERLLQMVDRLLQRHPSAA